MTIEPAYYYGGGVPVFKPTWDQFRDFNSFVTQIDAVGAVNGIVKIIPPSEWLEQVRVDPRQLVDIKIRSAIEQVFHGSRGVYTQMNVTKSKKYSVLDWKQLCDAPQHRLPTGRAQKRPHDEEGTKDVVGNEDDELEQLAAVITSQKDKFPSSYNYPDFYSDVERAYWKNITFMPALYGADLKGTLFDSAQEHWNINRLNNMLDLIDRRLPGVNSPYLYFGMWKSTFAWHLEDMDLYSINYIHFGAPKQWYVIPPVHKDRFETVARGLFHEEAKKCSEFLRHKSFHISPSVLEKYSIPVHRCVQEEGEIVLTYPYGYHSGYNLGFNCAESINFALPRWIEIGKSARSCMCVTDSVRIDVSTVFDSNRTPSRKRSRVERPKCAMCGRKRGEMLAIVNNEKTKIHRVCAEWIPELVIVQTESGDEFVDGLNAVPRARKNLKCKYCHHVGGCIQCARGACVTAFHATCALQHELVQTSAEQHIDPYPGMLCPRHGQKIIDQEQQALAEKRASEAQKLSECLNVGDQVLVRFSDGSWHEGGVLELLKPWFLARIQCADDFVKTASLLDIKLK